MAKNLSKENVIYKTNVEYGDYTINHFQGCSHGIIPILCLSDGKRFGKLSHTKNG